jgi:hypothetical protein
MTNDVFNRYENKYRLDSEGFARVQRRLLDYMETDAYSRGRFTYPICNIYYDTDDNRLIRTSLSKPVYKEKLRLRSYGTPLGDAEVYAEIKRKFRGSVSKRRSAMRLSEAYALLAGGEMPALKSYMNYQVLREIKCLLARWDLKPKLYLAYERRAFFGAENSDLRISFDTGIVTRRDDLRLESGIYGAPLLPAGEWLMEIKTSQNMPLWLAKLLSEYGIYPIGFSKYGTEYRRSFASFGQGRGQARISQAAEAGQVACRSSRYAPGALFISQAAEAGQVGLSVAGGLLPRREDCV